jgi:hypothetical protein
MNIKTRLKRIEENLSGKQSGFCECFAVRFQTLVNFVYDGAPYKAKDLEVPTGNFCQKCQKPVNTALEQAFEKKAESVYGRSQK